MRARIYSIVIDRDTEDGPLTIDYENTRQHTMPELGDSATIVSVEEIKGYVGRVRVTWWERV